MNRKFRFFSNVLKWISLCYLFSKHHIIGLCLVNANLNDQDQDIAFPVLIKFGEFNVKFSDLILNVSYYDFINIFELLK